MITYDSEYFQSLWAKSRAQAEKLIEEEMKLSPGTEKFQYEVTELLKYKWRDVCAQDFYFFVTEGLGVKGLSEEFHGDMCDFLQTDDSSKLLLAPRGHLKSTIGTVDYALWEIVKNPDVRILIANYKLDNAKAFLYQMRNEFMTNETFRELYKHLIPSNLRDAKWNESHLTVRRNKNLKESTVEVTGVGGEITGKHYDIIIYDDVVGAQNIETLDQAQKLRNWWNQTQAVLEPGGKQILIGTRWHYADLYGFILENLTHEFKSFHRGVFKADGTPLWPEKFTPSRIETIKRRMESDPKQGRALFVAQYLNQVMDEENAAFKRSDLLFYDKDEAPRSLAVTISLDPAISEKESADRSAFIVRGVDSKRHWWVLETLAKRGMNPTEQVDTLFRLVVKYRALYGELAAVGVEAQSYQKALIHIIKEKMNASGIYFNLVELGNWRNSKEYRIKALIPYFNMQMVHIPKPAEGDDSEILVDELLRFPKSAHDDCTDALSFHLEFDVEATEDAIVDPSEDIELEDRDRYGYKRDIPNGTMTCWL